MDFQKCCSICIGNTELVEQFNRLTGHKLGAKRTPFEMAIDKACGYDPDKEAIKDFCEFVFQFIWIHLVAG